MTLLIHVLATAAVLQAPLELVAKLPGEPSVVSAAGINKAEQPVLTIEHRVPADAADPRRRLVIVGRADVEGSSDAVLAAVRWLKTDAPKAVRDRWLVSAMPSAATDSPDAKSVSRWVTFQAPDLIVSIGTTLDLDGVRIASIPSSMTPTATIRALQVELAREPGARSALHDTMAARLRRSPLDTARLLAKRYPETPSISYIPSVSWVNTLRLGAIDNDASLRQKVVDQAAPWISGEKKMFGDRIQLTSVAGAMVFAELAKAGGGEAAGRLANEAAALASAFRPDGIAQYGQGWTDDMFMASSILSRTGNVDVAAKLLTAYAARLQRADGIFNHALDGPAAWGRGNGFAALGIIEALTAMPAAHPSRPALLDIYKRHMAALKEQQSPDGMWREVIDNPAAYREETATAMLLTAMARGIRLGWIDRSYTPFVERAWRGLATHVVDDGTVIDVCTGTGAGPTPRYYFDRAAITGADDRGGAMALLASMEMYEFSRGR